MPPKPQRTVSHMVDQRPMGAVPSRGSMTLGISRDFQTVVSLDIEKLSPHPAQPRRHFDDASIANLAANIAEFGQITPILVTEAGPDRYHIIAGERRVRALKLLDKTSVYAIVAKGDGARLALIDNEQRENLNAVDQAAAYQRLLDDHAMAIEEIAAMVNKSPADLRLTLQINHLPDTIKREYPAVAERIPRSLLAELAYVTDADLLAKLWAAAKGDGVTREQIRAARREKAPPKPPDGNVLRRVSTVLTKTDKQIQELELNVEALAPPHYEQLVSLRDRIDRLLSTQTAKS